MEELRHLQKYNGGFGDLVEMLVSIPGDTSRITILKRVSIALVPAIHYRLRFFLSHSMTHFLNSDLGTTTVHSDPVTHPVPFADHTGVMTYSNAENLWMNSLGVFPTFAEATIVNGTWEPDVSDTGTVQRAILPFESAERTLPVPFHSSVLFWVPDPRVTPLRLWGWTTRILLYVPSTDSACHSSHDSSLRGLPVLVYKGGISAELAVPHAGLSRLRNQYDWLDYRGSLRVVSKPHRADRLPLDARQP